MTEPSETIARWISALQDEPLTRWEESFIQSLDDQMEEHGSISDKQEEVLKKMYEEKI